MSNLIQKICWNENSYQKPDISGYYVDQGKDNYIANFGVGHESWNFNRSELIDGKVYGYLQADVPTLFNELHNIFFFSKNLNGEFFLVGYYKDCKYLTHQERIELSEKMMESGILDKRINQAYRTLKDIDDYSDISWETVENHFKLECSSFKLEVLPENITIFDPKIPLIKEECVKVLNKGWQDRYGNYTLFSNLEDFMKNIIKLDDLI